MAQPIRIKRRTNGGGAGAPDTLLQGELAYNEQTDICYYGWGTGGTATVKAIAGEGAFATKSYVASAVAAVDVSSQLANYLPLTGGTISSNLTVTGNFTVNGTTSVINSTTLQVADKNIELAKIASPTDTTADGAGLTVKGATDKTLNWVQSVSAWTSSEDFNLLVGKVFKINGVSVLSSTTLGSGITGSSLTSVGTLTSGALGTGFTTVGVAQGGSGATTLTGVLKGNGTSAFTAAVAGTDYLSPSSDIDGGTY